MTGDYVVTDWSRPLGAAAPHVLATIGVVVGTVVSERLLKSFPESIFRKTVGLVILLLGLYMFAK